LANCKFTSQYYDYERQATVDYSCDSKDEEDILSSGFCIFHDENYLKDEGKRKEHEQNIRNRIMDKVRNSIDLKVPLFCIGYTFQILQLKILPSRYILRTANSKDEQDLLELNSPKCPSMDLNSLNKHTSIQLYSLDTLFYQCTNTI
jgi:hypothetical protein